MSKGSPRFHGLIKKSIVLPSAAMLLFNPLSASAERFGETVSISSFSPSFHEENVSRFTLESASGDFSLVDTPFQKKIKSATSSGGAAVTVETGAASAAASPPADTASMLRDTRFLALTAPEITAAARSCGASGDPVYAVEKFVDRVIERKITGIPLLPALNILKSRAGDCTEHAVLSVALLRAQKIPSRAVVGMIFTDEYRGEKNVFVFHMWVEAWFRGRWRLVDATRPGQKKFNAYIAFAYHSLETETPLAYLRAVSAIQNLKVRYLK